MGCNIIGIGYAAEYSSNIEGVGQLGPNAVRGLNKLLEEYAPKVGDAAQ